MIKLSTVLNALLACVRLTVLCDKCYDKNRRWLYSVTRWVKATSMNENDQEELHRGGFSPFLGAITKERRMNPFCSPYLFSRVIFLKNEQNSSHYFPPFHFSWLPLTFRIIPTLIWHAGPYRSGPCIPFSLNFLCWLPPASLPYPTSLSPLTHLSLAKRHLGFIPQPSCPRTLLAL